MQSLFIVNTVAFRKQLKAWKKLVPAYRYSGILHIGVEPFKVRLKAAGLEQTMEATTEGFADLHVPFQMLYKLVLAETYPVFRVVVCPGELKSGTFSAKNENIKVTSFLASDEINLPMNYTQMDLLALRYSHGATELANHGWLSKVNLAEVELEQALNAAHRKLRDYGVTYEELSELVEAYVKSKARNST